MTLNHQLNLLESTGLIRLTQSIPELEYLFRHALVQDAAYASLVKHDRRSLHWAVGQALERMYPDRREELAPLLGWHFSNAGDDVRALEYFTLAGDAAARVYANSEAAAHYAQALEVARRRADTSAETLNHLYTRRGQALELNGRHAEALSDYGEMERLARARGDRSLELAALMARAKIYATLNQSQDPAQARFVLEQALSLARELGDRAAEGKVLWNLMLLLLWSGGDQRQSVAYGEQALALARELGLREQLAYTLNDLAYGYMSIERWPRVQAALDESRELWRELGNLPMLADNLANSVLMHFRAGRFQAAIESAAEAQRISQSISNLWGQAGSRVYVGLVYLERGEPGRAISIMEEAVRLGEQSGHPGPSVATRADLGWAYGLMGAIERGLELARLARKQAGEVAFLSAHSIGVLARLHMLNGDRAAAQATLEEGFRELKPDGLQWFAPIVLPLAQAELALADGDSSQAIEVVDTLLADLRQSATRLFVPDTLCVKGKALLALDRRDEAYTALNEARTEAEAIGSRRTLWPILMALSEIEAQRRNQTEADGLRRQAREIVEFIADHAGSPELRASFLGLPDIRDLLSNA